MLIVDAIACVFFFQFFKSLPRALLRRLLTLIIPGQREHLMDGRALLEIRLREDESLRSRALPIFVQP
jgi:hypothetical protein